MILARLLFARLLLIWILIVGHGIAPVDVELEKEALPP
jgi:hypothetical protein